MMSTSRTWLTTAVATVALATAAAGAVLATDPAAPAAAAGVASYRGVPECRARDVDATYHAVDAGAGHTFGRITLRNTSERICSIRGYGGLSYVGLGDGTQIGAAATRTRSREPRTVLHPGDHVGSLVSAADPQDYSTADCRPAPVDGFRVYLPDERQSLYVRHATTGCLRHSVHLLAHQAYR